MRQIFILLNIFLWFSNSIFSQSTKEDSTKLLELEWSYYQSNNSIEKSNIAFKKFSLYINSQLEHHPGILAECERITSENLNIEDQKKYLWNASMIYFMHNNFSRSSELLNKYRIMTNDSSIAFQLLYILSLHNSPYDSISKLGLHNEILELVSCFEQTDSSNLHTKNNFNRYSYVIPGSGMILKGYPLQGTNAFVINGLSGLLIYILLKKTLYINAIGLGMLTIAKFYIGNLNYTRKLLRKKVFKEQREATIQCHTQLELLIQSNPIEFHK